MRWGANAGCPSSRDERLPENFCGTESIVAGEAGEPETPAPPYLVMGNGQNIGTRMPTGGRASPKSVYVQSPSNLLAFLQPYTD